VQTYLNELNENQRQAVVNTKGPTLVIAGAGSGKTRVLTYRIAHMLGEGVHPASILSLTFTNKAAREMKERIQKVVGDHSKSLWMGTFHSIFAKILRFEAQSLGFNPAFTIYDTDDAKKLLKDIISSLKLDIQTYTTNAVLSRISWAKNNLMTPSAYSNNQEVLAHDKALKIPETGKIYKTYMLQCQKNSAMDFDDLLLYTNILFRDHPTVLAKYQDRFKYILVDEYQDTNYSQYTIVKKLAANHKNLCVVGDDSQSIYGFRGARIENILNFKSDYPDYKIFKLEQNYRSTQNIVNAANSVIERNKNRIPKEVFSQNDIGKKLQIIETASDQEEGYTITSRIRTSIRDDNYDYKNFAILYRTNAQSRIFEEAFLKFNMPYKIYSGVSFYQRKEIKDVLAYCRLTVNRNDTEALKRIINYPKRGIGDTSVEKMETNAAKLDVSLWEYVSNIKKYPTDIGTATLGRVEQFIALITDFSSKITEIDAYELVKHIVTASGILKDLYEDKTTEGVNRYQNVDEMINSVKEFVSQQDQDSTELTLDKYLQDVTLMTNLDEGAEEDTNKISMMTIHTAKGLEFKSVFIVGMEEGLFPSGMTQMTLENLEEERRLFYVALTRAETNLTISFARTRQKWGSTNDCMPSRFINEIDFQYIESNSKMFGYVEPEIEAVSDDDEDEKHTEVKKNAPTMNVPRKLTKLSHSPNPQVSHASSGHQTVNAGSLSVGTKVEHQRFGVGSVTNLEPSGDDVKATIHFDISGTKQLLLKYAKLKIL